MNCTNVIQNSTVCRESTHTESTGCHRTTHLRSIQEVREHAIGSSLVNTTIFVALYVGTLAPSLHQTRIRTLSQVNLRIATKSLEISLPGEEYDVRFRIGKKTDEIGRSRRLQ